MNVLYVGSGAVNLCLAGWMHSGTTQTMFLVRSDDHELIGKQAFQCRLPGDKNARVYTCRSFASLKEIEQPDLIVFGVKSYSLDAVVRQVLDAYGPDVQVMSVLNGVRHVEVLQAKFTNPIFATIAFNAYRVSPTMAVAEGGTLALSCSDLNNATLQKLHYVLKRKISVKLVGNPLDAARCKLVLNLGNALLTIVGFHKHRNRELDVLQQLSAQLLWEGVQTIRTAGTQEVRIPGMPPWALIWLSSVLPKAIVVPIFKKKLSGTVINSMAQDVEAGGVNTELEDINGYLLQLAENVGVEVPYNRALYQIFKEWQASGGQALKPSELLSRINSFSKR
ncbi:MAG: hypothetical protein EP314_06270 [Bacteroidetes bacterium]|nr:MAG: hypothetical protein EP314_06270 [Bacteroidota bacterium]